MVQPNPTQPNPTQPQPGSGARRSSRPCGRRRGTIPMPPLWVCPPSEALLAADPPPLQLSPALQEALLNNTPIRPLLHSLPIGAEPAALCFAF